MDNNEQRNDNSLPKEPDRQIQLVVNRPADNETAIDLGNVFFNMKRRRRLFACVLVLCLLVGIVAPLLMYQFTKPFLTVSSVATLRYEVPKKVKKEDENGEEIWVIPENPEYEMVTDLTAPDGTDLDLNQITSSYVQAVGCRQCPGKHVDSDRADGREQPDKGSFAGPGGSEERGRL